jgi:hypothetical protein
MRAMRRLSKLPPSGLNLEQLMDTYRPQTPHPNQRSLPTPPLGRTSSNLSVGGFNTLQLGNFNSHSRSSSDAKFPFPHTSGKSPPSTQPPSALFQRRPIPASEALPSMFSKMNRRQTAGSVPPSPTSLPDEATSKPLQSSRPSVAFNSGNAHLRARSETGSLRALMLPKMRVAPTF